MILDQPLTAEQRAVSQKNYNRFNVINGFSYMCLGETVLILLAVQIACPDWVVAALGAMMYIGFLMLPWGRVVTARVGAAKAQASFWVARNVAALLVAFAAFLYHGGHGDWAMAALLTGAFLFYGFRAAGVVMSQPLIAEIASDVERGPLLAKSGGYFYAACFVALIAITAVLTEWTGPWTLPGVIVVGALLGCTASRFLAKIDETSAPRDSARRPIRGELAQVAANPVLWRLLLSGFAVNVAIILIIPMSMMVLKKGLMVPDDKAMYFAICQYAACAAMSFVTGRIAARIGPRKLLLYAYAAVLLIGALWQVVPPVFSAWTVVPVFLLCGAALVSLNNANIHYFLQTIPVAERVTASMFVSVFTGAGAGIAGTFLAKGLLALGARWHPDDLMLGYIGRALGIPLTTIWARWHPDDLMRGYRDYFLLAALALLPGLWLIHRLRPLPEEQRPVRRDVFDLQSGNRMNYLRRSGPAGAAPAAEPAAGAAPAPEASPPPLEPSIEKGNDQ